MQELFNMLFPVPGNALHRALAILSSFSSLDLSLEATSTEKMSLTHSPKKIIPCACLRFTQPTSYFNHHNSNSLVKVSPDSTLPQLYLASFGLCSRVSLVLQWELCMHSLGKGGNWQTHNRWELVGHCFSLPSLEWIVLRCILHGSLVL